MCLFRTVVSGVTYTSCPFGYTNGRASGAPELEISIEHEQQGGR